MSSKAINKKFVKIEFEEEDGFDLNRIIIPFSLFFPKNEHFIYDGSEKIPFSKRDPSFKTIFLQEFTEDVRNIRKRK
jgi:hypothetical protein